MSVIVFGSINLDLVATVEHRPQPGETLLASGFTSTPGGKGANQALAARKMGASVRMVGAVGNDSFAEPALSLLQQAGIDLSHVAHLNDSSTGLAFIHLDEQGENSITVVSGANYQVEAQGLAALEQILTAKDILVMQLEIPLTSVQQAIVIARRKGAAVLIDPAPGVSDLPAELLQVDIFIPNRGEAEMVLKHSIESIEQAREAAQELHQRGAKLGVVKLGAEGAVWANEQGTGYQPALKVQAIDSTGAGDAFAGALAAVLNQSTDTALDLAAAMRQASIFAALATTRLGAQQSYPTLAEVHRHNSSPLRGEANT
ncbi:ribokinase [Dictyobacter arantiisoli]|uniref:Ribokinase n=1 Tax=Dictyobacter arantiisoli TaxID=2014874 RepID=A0A5A5T9G1_9CHLR|nr:ribokinase [Dictyobacter arantiisoli]GCF07554.1 ribokinase [Dictyobacter arantiisoli]